MTNFVQVKLCLPCKQVILLVIPELPVFLLTNLYLSIPLILCLLYFRNGDTHLLHDLLAVFRGNFLNCSPNYCASPCQTWTSTSLVFCPYIIFRTVSSNVDVPKPKSSSLTYTSGVCEPFHGFYCITNSTRHFKKIFISFLDDARNVSVELFWSAIPTHMWKLFLNLNFWLGGSNRKSKTFLWYVHGYFLNHPISCYNINV